MLEISRSQTHSFGYAVRPLSNVDLARTGSRSSFLVNLGKFLPRDAMHKRGLCRHATSACPSVCPSHLFILSKRINISSTFTARRVCLARTMPSQDVRLSVRHTPVLSLKGYTYPQTFYHCRVAPPHILVFPHQTGWLYSDGDPPNRGVECRGVRKNHDFRPISRFISQMMQDRAIVTMEGE